MKPARLLLICLGIVVVVGVTGFCLAMTPSVQRWAVLRAARDAGLHLEVGSISAGWSGAVLRDVTLEKQRVVVTMGSVEADYPLWRLLVSRQLSISRLKVAGLTVDGSRVSRAKAEAAAVGAPAAAPGLLARVALPVDLALDDVRIEGRGVLPGAAGQPPVTTEFTISGGKFSPGQEGLLQFNATLRNPAPNAKVTALRVQAGLRATLTTQRSFNNVILTTVVDAEGLAPAGQSQLKVSAELFRTTSGESYVFGVDTILRGTIGNALKIQARLAAANQQYAGEWELNMRTPQLEPFMLGRALPDFDLKGNGSFTFDPGQRAFNVQGGLKGQGSRWEAIEPAWRAFGPLSIDTTFDLGQREGVVHLGQFKAVLAGAKPVIEVRSVSPVHYDLKKQQLVADGATAEKLLEIRLHGVPVDWVRPFVTTADVSGEEITGQVDLSRVSNSAAAASLRGRLQAGGITLVKEGRMLLNRADVILQGEAVVVDGHVDAPALEFKVVTAAKDSLTITGKLNAQTGTAAQVAVEGQFSGLATKMLARWFPGAAVTAQGDLKFVLRGDEMEISPGRAQAWQGRENVLLNAAVLQPFTVDLKRNTIRSRDADQPVARIELGRLPLGLLPLTQPGVALGGVVQQGVFELNARNGTCTLKAIQPLRLAGVSLTEDQSLAFTDLAIEARPVVEYAGPDSLKIQSGDLTMRTRTGALVASLKGESVQAPGQGTQTTITFNVEVPALAGQPLFAGAQAVSAGRASGEIRATTDGLQRQLEARLTLNGLIAAESGQTLPVANLGFRGLVRSNNTISLEAPLLLDNSGRRSDLRFALELSPLGAGYSVDGHLTGQQVALEDLLGVLGVFHMAAAPDDGGKPGAVGPVPPDTAAAWSRFSGQLVLDIKSATKGKDWAMTGLAGTVAIEPTRLALQKLAASFSETSRLAAQMEMKFTGGAVPYRLTGDYALNDFDSGKLFRAFDPGKPATVEGLFTVNGKFAGNGETPARALDRIQGDFQLTSRQGIFRGLQRSSSKASMAANVGSKVAEIGSALGSLLGSEKVTKIAEKAAGQTYQADQLAQAIGEFNYDLLSLHLTRNELLDMSLEDISLVSPEIRLNGRGEVSYVAGQSLLAQPLKASLNFSVRGKVEQILDKLNALDGTRDELGYARTRDAIALSGTLDRPDPIAYFIAVGLAKLAEHFDGRN